MIAESHPIQADREIISTRIVDYPQALVFSAWTEAEHLKNWWGPAGFTNTFHVFELRPGGRWEFTMHGPDKGHYANTCEFTEIERPRLLAWKRFSKPIFHVIARFEEVAGHKTEIVYRMIFDTPEECDKVRSFAGDKNEENFDRLERELAEMAQD